MLYIFYFLGFFSTLFTMLVIIQNKPIYALLYLILSLLSISGIFFILGAVFAAALEVIIYAGAIMLLFVFVIMMLNIGEKFEIEEKKCLYFSNWKIPGTISILFLINLLLIISFTDNKFNLLNYITNIQDLGKELFTNYLLIIEISSILLLSALVIVFHLNKEIELNNIKLSVNNKLLKNIKDYNRE